MFELTDEFVTSFKQKGYGCIASFCCIDGVNWQTHLFAYLPDMKLNHTEKPQDIKIELTIESKDNLFPLVLLSVSLTNNSSDPLCLEVYLNPKNENECMAIEGLTVQTRLDIHLFKEDFSYHNTLVVPWYKQAESWETYLLALNLAEGNK